MKIAITGGMGMGKSYMARQFAAMNFPIYYADHEARKLYQNEKVKQLIREEFGDDSFTQGEVDFKKLATILFENKENQEKINRIIHPLVRADFEKWAKEQNSAMIFMEAALIYEAGFENDFDLVIVVDTPPKLRMQRLLKRDPALSEEEINRRIAMQMAQEEKKRRADVLILNGEGEGIRYVKG